MLLRYVLGALFFYRLYAPLFPNLRQDAEKSEDGNLRQDAENFEMLFSIPWTHHQKIIDKVKGDSQKAMFFVQRNHASHVKEYGTTS